MRRPSEGMRLPWPIAALVALWTCLGGPLAAAAAGPPRLPQENGRPPQLPIVRSIRVEGNRRYTAEQLVSALGQAVGQPLLGETERKRGIKTLFDTFHVRAQLEVERTAGDEAVDLLLRVEELPFDLEMRITGNHEIDDDKVREWAGIGEREELYIYQAPRVRARLLQHYRDEGFYFAEVDSVERPTEVDPASGEPVAPDVVFRITEGPEVKVRAVEIEGNTILPASTFLFFGSGLTELAGTELHGPGLLGRIWRGWAKDFVSDTLDADIVALRQVYRDLGYLDAVVEVDHLEFSPERDWVTIHIAIEEGQPFVVESLDFRALRRVRDDQDPRGYHEEPTELLVDETELRAKLTLKPGDVFQQRFVDKDHRAIQQLYGERGHVEDSSLPEWEGFHFLDPELVFDARGPKVRVTYEIVEGEPITLREIQVRGNLHTQDRVIRRLITVKPGQLANPKEIERSRARIEATDYFSPNQFNRDVVPPHVRYVDTGDPGVKDLEFAVQEGSVLDFQLSGGISSTYGLFGAITLRKSNFDVTNLPSSLGSTLGEIADREAFHGGGQSLTIQASPGSRISNYFVSFFEPDVFRMNEDYIGMGLDARLRNLRFDSHFEERREYGLRLVRQLTADSNLSLRYTIGTVDVTDLDTGGEPSLGMPLSVPADLKAQEGKSNLGHLDLTYRYTTVDSYLNPRNGFDTSLTAGVYDELLGSDFEFVRSQASVDFYNEFDESPDLVSNYVHLALALGGGFSYGSSDIVPYTERRFFGGNDLRGFRYRGVGPNESGFPTGGSTWLNGTVEFRQPLVKDTAPGSYRELELVQGGLFVDFGVLDPEEFSLDFQEMRVSAGFLLGIAVHPTLPLTFSFGFPLREGEDDRTQTFQFNIGF